MYDRFNEYLVVVVVVGVEDEWWMGSVRMGTKSVRTGPPGMRKPNMGSGSGGGGNKDEDEDGDDETPVKVVVVV